MRPILFVLLIAGILFCNYWKKAHGQPVAQNDMSIIVAAPDVPSIDFSNQSGAIATVNWLVLAAKSHDWIVVVGILLAFVVAGFRWGLPRLHDKIGAWFNTEQGKGVLVLGCAELGAFSTEAIMHQVSLQTILDGIVVAFFTAGGYSILKPIITKVFGGPPAPAAPPTVKKPDIAPKGPPAPVAPAALVIALVGLGLGLSGCTPAQTTAWKKIGGLVAQQCAIPGAQQALVDVVNDAGQPGATAQSVAEDVAIRDGVAATLCAADVFFKNAGDLVHAKLSPQDQIAVDALHYIQQHADELAKKAGTGALNFGAGPSKETH